MTFCLGLREKCQEWKSQSGCYCKNLVEVAVAWGREVNNEDSETLKPEFLGIRYRIKEQGRWLNEINAPGKPADPTSIW